MYNMLRYTQNTNRQKRKKVKELRNENETRKESKREKKVRKKEGRKLFSISTKDLSCLLVGEISQGRGS